MNREHNAAASVAALSAGRATRYASQDGDSSGSSQRLRGGGRDGATVDDAYEELTRDQLSGLHALLQGSGPPNADFSVWGSFLAPHREARQAFWNGHWCWEPPPACGLVLAARHRDVERIVSRVALRIDHAWSCQFGHPRRVPRHHPSARDVVHSQRVGAPVPGRRQGSAGASGAHAWEMRDATFSWSTHGRASLRPTKALELGLARGYRRPVFLGRRAQGAHGSDFGSCHSGQRLGRQQWIKPACQHCRFKPWDWRTGERAAEADTASTTRVRTADSQQIAA